MRGRRAHLREEESNRCGSFTINPTIDPSASLPWRSPPLRLALALIPGWITLAALAFNVGWPTKAIVGAELALSIASPVAGFLAAVLFAPFGHLVGVTITVENFRLTEAAVLAFFVGWLMRGWQDRDGPRAPRLLMPLLAAVVVGSVAGLAWQVSKEPGELARQFGLLTRLYNMADDRIGFVAAARLLEGIALAAAAITLFRARPRLADLVPGVLAAGGLGAAAASWLLWYGIAPAAVLRDHARNGYRVAAHVVDANAAGSYFAMLTCLALGLALRGRGRVRAVWLLVAGANASGVWLSASRSALAAGTVAAIVVVVWWAAARLRSRAVVFALAGVLALAAVGGIAYLWHISRGQLSQGTTLRVQFNETSTRMMAARPIVGVGIGQYYRRSALFLTPQLAWLYGFENAHNYFLQTGAELGLPGLVLFAALLLAGLWRAGRGAIAQPQDARLVGVACGTAAFLATAFVSHPFLVDEAALPFWVQFGMLLGLADAWREGRRSASRRQAMAVAAAAAACVIVSPALRAWRGPLAPAQTAAVDGLYGWETDADGTRYRWTEGWASVFAAADVVRVDIPVRIPEGARGLDKVTVTPSVDGHRRASVDVGPSWSVVEVDVPPAEGLRFRRVNLRVEPTWQPALYVPGSADMRRVGVEIGEPTFVRGR